MNVTISPTVARPAHVQDGAEISTMTMTAMVESAARQHVHHRPPVQHGELVRDHLVGDLAEAPGFRRQPGEGLHTTMTLASASCAVPARLDW